MVTQYFGQTWLLDSICTSQKDLFSEGLMTPNFLQSITCLQDTFWLYLLAQFSFVICIRIFKQTKNQNTWLSFSLMLFELHNSWICSSGLLFWLQFRSHEQSINVWFLTFPSKDWSLLCPIIKMTINHLLTITSISALYFHDWSLVHWNVLLLLGIISKRF